MLKYELLRSNLTKLIQNSGLEVGAVLFILRDVSHEIEKLYYEHINQEIRSQKQGQLSPDSKEKGENLISDAKENET